MILLDGGSFVWRNGDAEDPDTHVKCMIETGGNTVGNPGVTHVAAISYVYVWDN
jgi:hypothetical protein